MKTLTLALGLSALALLVGCSSFASKPGTATAQAAPAAANTDRVKMVDPDHAQVTISTRIFKVTLDSKDAKDFEWSQQPHLVEQLLQSGRNVASDGQRAAHLFKGMPGFTENDLIGILERQGKVSQDYNNYVHTISGTAAPFSTSETTGYLVATLCPNGETLAYGEDARNYTYTPKIDSDGNVVFDFLITQATTSCETTLDQSAILGGKIRVSTDETIVASILGGKSSENTQEVLVSVIKLWLRP